MADKPVSYIRFLHAVSDGPALDFYVNGKRIASNVSFKEFTEYFTAMPGLYNIEIYGAGSKDAPVLEETVQLDYDMIYTFAVSGLWGDISAKIVVDRKRAVDKSKSYIRFINLSPLETSFDIHLNDIEKLTDLVYEEASEYLKVSPSTYYLKVLDSFTGTAVLLDPRLPLRAGKIHSCYIVGIEGSSEGLIVLVPLERASY